MQDKVSIIIPAYNRADLLRESLASALEQDYRPLEVIVVDDGSTIDIKSVVDELSIESDIPVIYHKKENEGPGPARRKGLELASGTYFQYLDSDDGIRPGKIKRQMEVLKANPEAIMCYCKTAYLLKSTGEKLKQFGTKSFDRILPQLLIGRPWDTNSPLWRYNKENTYWTNLRTGQDKMHDFLAGLEGKPIVHLDEELAIVYKHEEGHHHHDLKASDQGMKSRAAFFTRIANELLKRKPEDEEMSLLVGESLFVMGLRFCKKGNAKTGDELFEKAIELVPGVYIKSAKKARMARTLGKFIPGNLFKRVYLAHRNRNPKIQGSKKFI